MLYAVGGRRKSHFVNGKSQNSDNKIRILTEFFLFFMCGSNPPPYQLVKLQPNKINEGCLLAAQW